MITRVGILLTAFVAAAITLAQLPDAERVRWVDRADFVGIRFVVDGDRCRAGVFGGDVGLAGAVCEGDPWAR